MKALWCALLLVWAVAAFGQASEVAKPDPGVENRLKALAEELRCLVCQNQTIADSNATLAIDLRKQIREQIAQGATDAQIRDYMVNRYGDFVLYRPPFKATTVVLWAGPALLLAGGAIAFWFAVRRRRAPNPEASPGSPRRAEIEKLLGETADK